MTSRKKGVSIGAAMKQRMGQGELDSPPAGGQRAPVQATTPPPTPVAQPQHSPADEPLESFNTRLPRGLHRRLKVHAATAGVKIQDAVQTALETYLQEEESKLS